MNNRQAVRILQEFEAVRPTPPDGTEKKWKWAVGVHLFPEAQCPFCMVVMRSPLLWRIDETAKQLRLVVGVGTGKMVSMRLRHPHVDEAGGGRICMSSHVSTIDGATSAAEALFLGIDPRSSMLGVGNSRNGQWDSWLREYFGHTKHDDAGLRRRTRPKMLKVGRAVRAKKV